MTKLDPALFFIWLAATKLRPSARSVLTAIVGDMVTASRNYAELNQAEIASRCGCSHRRIKPFLDELSRLGLVVETVPDKTQANRQRLRFYLGPDIAAAITASAIQSQACGEQQDQAAGMPAQSGSDETAMRPASTREKVSRLTTTSETPPAA